VSTHQNKCTLESDISDHLKVYFKKQSLMCLFKWPLILINIMLFAITVS